MKRFRLLVLGLALALLATPVHAFEETKQKVAPPDKAAAGAAAGEGQGQPKVPLNIDGTGTSIDPAPSTGSDIRIPGLGKLGVWPKLDFGLELLYGGRDSSKVDEPGRGVPDSSDGMQIKGHIKHRW